MSKTSAGSQSLAEQLTAQEVLKELDGVTEWRFFGLCLGIPLDELQKSTERKDIVHKWLEMGQASWQKLVNALISYARQLNNTPKPRRQGVRCTNSALVCTSFTGVQENGAICWSNAKLQRF